MFEEKGSSGKAHKAGKKKKKKQTMSHRKSCENNSCLQIRVLQLAEGGIYMGAFAFLGNIFSDYLQGTTCLPPLFSWRKIRFAFSPWRKCPFHFCREDSSVDELLLQGLCCLYPWWGLPSCTAVPGHTPAVLHLLPSPGLWGGNGEKRGMRRSRKTCLSKF